MLAKGDTDGRAQCATNSTAEYQKKGVVDTGEVPVWKFVEEQQGQKGQFDVEVACSIEEVSGGEGDNVEKRAMEMFISKMKNRFTSEPRVMRGS